MKINLKSGYLWRRVWVNPKGFAFLEEDKIPPLKAYSLEVDENSFTFYTDGEKKNGKFYFQGDNLILVISNFSFIFTKVGELSISQEKGEDDIRSELPGKVLRISVEKGNIVEKDSPLMVLEAMKMEHTITSKKKARIKEVYVKEGQVVQEGDLLITLE